MGLSVTLDDFIYLLSEGRVAISEDSKITPNQFFNAVSKNKCCYRVARCVPPLDYDTDKIYVKKEFLPTEENIQKSKKEYETLDYVIVVKIPPISSCLKFFFGDSVEYDGNFRPEGNVLATDFMFMLSMPVNVEKVPDAVSKRFTVSKMYSKEIRYDGSSYYYYNQTSGKVKNAVKYSQIINISNNLRQASDEQFNQIVKDIRLCKMLCTDHSPKFLVSRAVDSTSQQIQDYAKVVFRILSKIH